MQKQANTSDDKGKSKQKRRQTQAKQRQTQEKTNNNRGKNNQTKANPKANASKHKQKTRSESGFFNISRALSVSVSSFVTECCYYATITTTIVNHHVDITYMKLQVQNHNSAQFCTLNMIMHLTIRYAQYIVFKYVKP